MWELAGLGRQLTTSGNRYFIINRLVLRQSLIFDRDLIFNSAVVRFVKAMGTKPARTAYRCHWQNPDAERWIGSCRRELLAHVVPLGERHLVRLLHSYLAYDHEDRSHLGLGKDTPDRRPVAQRPLLTAIVVALPRLGGVHHR